MRRTVSSGMQSFDTLPMFRSIRTRGAKERKPALKKNSTEKMGKKRTKEIVDQKLLTLMKAHQSKQAVHAKLTIGLDLGDRVSCYCVLDEEGEVIGRSQVVTEKQPLEVVFGKFPPSLVALEVGTHSPWISRLLEELGHEVIVA